MLPSFRTRHVARLGLTALALALEVATPLAATSVAHAQIAPVTTTAATSVRPAVACQDTGPLDYPISGGWFYTQEGRGCITGLGPVRRRGYLVIDDADGSFWTEFRRYGGKDVLGYPVSQRFHYPVGNAGGYLYQAFERGILQWQPETGRAQMANVFEQFTELGLDADLEALGIPNPAQADASASFAADAERRMGLLSEPRFLARYFFDPAAPHSSEPGRTGASTFGTQEEAWSFFGLPQSLPQQLALRGPAPNLVSLYPLAHAFVAQRFQKGGMQLFLQNASENFTAPGWSGNPSFLLDPTIVPGDGRNGCVALTAVGLLARTVGADKLIPSSAIQALPLDPAPKPFVDSFVPPVDPGQLMVQFQLSGIAFAASEPITIHLTDARLSATGTALPSVTSKVTAANLDGSFDQILSARVGTFEIVATGDRSGKIYDGIIDLTVPSLNYTGGQTSTSCRDVGLPLGN
jgi:hypothetical protein